ncbi:hypothetical protein ABZ023_32615 [Streptomyces sp. NPDC006367]|uniref:hypothetical protein n=1 Tax=unclassified Streptomyces TaxID=2593676 RepID=UPI0033B9E8CA
MTPPAAAHLELVFGRRGEQLVDGGLKEGERRQHGGHRAAAHLVLLAGRVRVVLQLRALAAQQRRRERVVA